MTERAPIARLLDERLGMTAEVSAQPKRGWLREMWRAEIAEIVALYPGKVVTYPDQPAHVAQMLRDKLGVEAVMRKVDKQTHRGRLELRAPRTWPERTT
jgi:hypothetical protein